MAQYLQTTGGTVSLPDNARLDLAYTLFTPVGTVTQPAQPSYTVSGIAYEVLLSAYGQFTASANVGTRQPVLDAYNAGNVLMWQSSTGATQTATSTVVYVWGPSFSVVQTTGGSYQVAQLPPWVFNPGDYITLSVANAMASDQWTNVAITVLRIPVGPALDATAVGPVATPILV